MNLAKSFWGMGVTPARILEVNTVLFFRPCRGESSAIIPTGGNQGTGMLYCGCPHGLAICEFPHGLAHIA